MDLLPLISGWFPSFFCLFVCLFFLTVFIHFIFHSELEAELKMNDLSSSPSETNVWVLSSSGS